MLDVAPGDGDVAPGPSARCLRRGRRLQRRDPVGSVCRHRLQRPVRRGPDPTGELARGGRVIVPRMSARAAVVTGVGVVNAIANDFDAFVEAMRIGRCGQRPIASFDAGGLRNPRACEAADFDPRRVHERRNDRRMDRSSELVLAAFDQAVAMAGIRLRDVEPVRGAVVLGSTLGGSMAGFRYYRAVRVNFSILWCRFTAYCADVSLKSSMTCVSTSPYSLPHTLHIWRTCRPYPAFATLPACNHPPVGLLIGPFGGLLVSRVVNPSDTLTRALRAASRGLARAETSGFDGLAERVRDAAAASRRLTLVVEQLARQGYRPLGASSEAVPHESAVSACADVRRTVGALAQTTPRDLSFRYREYASALEALIALGEAVALRGVESASVSEPPQWQVFR